MMEEDKTLKQLEIVASILVILLTFALLYADLKEISPNQYEYIKNNFNEDCHSSSFTNTKKVRVHQYRIYKSCVETKEKIK